MATTTRVTVAKWGNSLGVRLPKAVAKEAQIGEGDEVSITISRVEPKRRRRSKYTLEELLHNYKRPPEGIVKMAPVGKERL